MKFIFGTYLENSIGTYKNIIKIYNRFIHDFMRGDKLWNLLENAYQKDMF